MHYNRQWLKTVPRNRTSRAVIYEPYTHESEVMCHRVWYRGDADELQQFYRKTGMNDAAASRFWAAVPYGNSIRKIHSGLPANMVDTLGRIILADYDGADFTDAAQKERWGELQQAIGFQDVLGHSIRDTLITGDGAFKITWDTTKMAHPALEFVGADRVAYRYFRGFLHSVSFFTDYPADSFGRETYQLEELYETGKISYRLFNEAGREIPLRSAPELVGLKAVELPNNILAAVPLHFFRNSRWPERGRSIFSGKTDVFDAHDEVISQWMDAIRSGRVQKYIPEDMLPRDPRSGRICSLNDFGSQFIQARRNGEEAPSKIDIVQPDIQYEAFVTSYCSTLDMCLQGVLSPATLGITISADESGVSLREQKDITGFTRNQITGKLEEVIPAVIKTVLQIDDWITGKVIGTYQPAVSFGEYATPDFSSRAETIQQAALSRIMSIETQVRELWGSSKDEAWIQQEVQRIKSEKECY